MMTSSKYRVNVHKQCVINHLNKILKPCQDSNHYLRVSIHRISKSVHRLIWEHCNGPIVEGLEIDHIDNNRQNNAISNLRLLTHQQNTAKAAQQRDYTFAGTNHERKHRVSVTDCTTEKMEVLPSLYSASKYCGINPGLIKMCCENKNNCKTGT